MKAGAPLIRWAAARVAALLLVMWGVSLVTFSLQLMAPGDAAEVLLRTRHEAPAPEQVDELRRRMGLDRPAWRQYLAWLGRAITLDLGRSYQNGEPVSREIAARLPATVRLALAAFALVVLLSSAAGLAGAAEGRPWLERILQPLSLALVSMPSFWLALLLITAFSLKLGWLPVAGCNGWGSLILPALSLGLGVAAMQGRVLRAGVLECKAQDYTRFALAKGLTPRQVTLRHVARNAMLPMVTMWGMSLGHLLGGAVVVETIFAWPGLGRLLVEAVLSRDLPMVQGAVLLMALLFTLTSLAADLVSRLLDPRLAEDAA